MEETKANKGEIDRGGKRVSGNNRAYTRMEQKGNAKHEQLGFLGTVALI